MNWITFALFSAGALAAADICVKLAAGKLSNSLGLLIYGSCTIPFKAASNLFKQLLKLK